MKLNKRYKRSIKENLSFYISSIILTIVTLMLFYLFYIAGTGINKFGDEFFERNHLEDAEFSVYTPIPDDALSELEEKYDVTLEAQNYINIKEKNFTARIFSSTEKINLYEITVGNDISSDGEIILSEGYADNMKVEIGDEITLRNKAYKVVGFFQRPDYLYMLEQTDDSYKNITSFFLAYLSDNDFKALGETPVQYFVRYGSANQNDMRREINDKYVMQSYLSADENARIRMVHEQADLFIYMSYVILVILPLIAVALICIILGRKVKSEQKIIGTLTALGYKKSRLMLHYAGFAAIPGLVGGVLSYTLAEIFSQPYGECGLTDYEPMRAEFSLPVLIGLFGIIVPTMMYVLAAMLAVRRILKNDAVVMLNGAVGANKRTKRLFVNSKMSFRKKYALRSLLANPARSFVVVMGIFLGSFIMLFTFSMIDSIEESSDTVLGEMGSYKYEYIFNSLKTEEPDQGEAVLIASLENSKQKSIAIMGTDNDNPYLDLSDENGNKIEIDDGYYITTYMALVLDLDANSNLELYNPLNLEKTTIKIDGIIKNDVQCAVYMTRENAENLLGLESNTYNAVMSDKELDFDESELSKTINADSIGDQLDTIMEQMGAMIYLMAVLGAVICIASIYVAVNMMMTENRNNISMLKVLGYTDRKINSVVLNANHILLPIGIALSMPALYFTMNLYFVLCADMFGMLIKTVILPKSYIMDICLIALCYFGSVFFIRRKTKKVDMVESLKDNRE